MPVPWTVWAFLAAGLAAASQSGNLVRLADADPLAIAAWRLFLAAALLAPLARGRLRQVRALTRGELALLVAAGLTLAAHFAAWIAAVQHTTVANAAIFFAVNPVITATAAHVFFRERVGWRLLLSIALGLLGVAATGLADVHLSRANLVGDGLAVLCSLLFTAYFLMGKKLRQKLDNRLYVTGLYAVAATASFAAVGLRGLPLADYGGRTWLAFLLLALLPTMLGHTSLNYALRYVEAGRISALTLSEPLLAGLVAWLAWDEPVRPWAAAGYGLICASVLVLVGDLLAGERPRATGPTRPG